MIPGSDDARHDRELAALRAAVRALADRVAQLEARLVACADPGVDRAPVPPRPNER